MRAAYINALGTADAIRIGELPAPEPGPGQVRVAVSATTVNHVDTFVRSGRFATRLTFPFVVGRDLVGTVDRVGAGVSGFGIGERVWCNSLGHSGRQGAAAQFAVVPVDRLYRLPDAAGPDAVTMLHPGATAYLGIVAHGKVTAGDTVVVVGAAGNVGGAAVVIAARAGAKVIAIARQRDDEYCRSLGAVDVIDPQDAGLPDRLAGKVDLWLDSAGVNDLRAAVPVLALRGRIVLMAGMNAEVPLPAGALYVKDGSIRGFAISNASVGELAAAAGTLNELLAADLLRARRVLRMPLSELATAHRMLESGALHGTRVRLDVP